MRAAGGQELVLLALEEDSKAFRFASSRLHADREAGRVLAGRGGAGRGGGWDCWGSVWGRFRVALRLAWVGGFKVWLVVTLVALRLA